MPNSFSSECIRGAHRKGLAATIRSIRRRVSPAMAGRLGGGHVASTTLPRTCETARADGRTECQAEPGQVATPTRPNPANGTQNTRSKVLRTGRRHFPRKAARLDPERGVLRSPRLEALIRSWRNRYIDRKQVVMVPTSLHLRGY
jgi:hypothetical protein